MGLCGVPAGGTAAAGGQVHMKVSIQLAQQKDLGRGNGLFTALFEFQQALFREPGAGFFHDEGLQELSRLVHFPDIRDGDVRDQNALFGKYLNEVFLRQPVQCLADRRAADLQFLAQRSLVEDRAGLIIAVKELFLDGGICKCLQVAGRHGRTHFQQIAVEEYSKRQVSSY
mgnify:FL=1